MKKLFVIVVFLVAFALFLGGSASADTYTIPLIDLDNDHLIDQGFGAPLTLTSRLPTSFPNFGWESFTVDTIPLGVGGKIGVGDGFDYNDTGFSSGAGFGLYSLPIGLGGMGDLTAYDSYGLRFYNPNAFSVDVNVFMNTGWVDAPNFDTNYFYQSSWETLLPGETFDSILWFSGAETYGGIYSGDVTVVENIDRVSNIGFQLLFPDLPGSGSYSASVDIAPVPIPGAIWLVGLGLLGLSRLRKRMSS